MTALLEQDDQDYLEDTEIKFFLSNLFQQVAAFRPEDSLDYALRYFKRVRSCHNVLGADFSFISGSSRNKRSFVFCLIELFRTFNDNEQMSINEYQQIIEMICPDFPSTIMPAVVSSLEVMNASASPPKYRHGDMSISLYFHIIYDEWLKYITTIFKEEGSLDCLSLFRFHAYVQDCRKNKRISYPQPPSECIDSAFEGVKSQEISFVILKKILFENDLVRKDVTSVRKCTSSLVSPEMSVTIGASGSSGSGSGSGSGSNSGDATTQKKEIENDEGVPPSNPPSSRRSSSSNRISAVSAVTSAEEKTTTSRTASKSPRPGKTAASRKRATSDDSDSNNDDENNSEDSV